MDRRNKLLGVLVGLAAAVAVAAAVAWPPRLREAADITVLRVGVLPSGSEAELQHRYGPLLAYLSRKTGWTFRLKAADSYQDLLHLFGAREIDMAHFGGLTFIQAQVLHGAVPLVMREVDSRATTSFIVKGGGAFQDCRGFRCDSLARARVLFGPELSTSGHLMARYFLHVERGIMPEAYFREVRYSSGHRATAYEVRDGTADVGMIYSAMLKAMLRDGQVKDGELHVIWETPPYPDNVWAVQGRVSERARTRLRDAFLALDVSDAAHAPILGVRRADSYLPAAAADFRPLMRIADDLGLTAAGRP